MMSDTKYGYSILFVEDEEALRKNYVIYLEMLFETVYEASDGEEAYKMYKEKKPNILIVDINIPKLNGLDLLTKIRESDHSTKAIVLTAHKEKSFLLKATSLKLTDFLVKPISRRALQGSLDKVIHELKSFNTIAIKNTLLSDGYLWKYDNKELSCHGTIIVLTNKEQILFSLFMNNLNTVLSIETILYSVWEDNMEVNISTLKTLLKNLRKKLPKEMIENVHGVGYKVKR